MGKTEELFSKFKEFWNINKRIPNTVSKEEHELYYWYNNNKIFYEPLVKFIKENNIDTRSSAERTFDLFKEFWFENHRLPKQNTKEEFRLYQWYRKRKEDYLPLIKFIRIQNIQIKTESELIFEKFKEFYYTNKRIPRYSEDFKLYMWYKNNRNKCVPLIEFCRDENIDTAL